MACNCDNFSSCHLCRELYTQRTGNNPYATGGPGHLPSLHAEIEELKDKLARAKADRDAYQAQVHSLNERAGMMTSAASSAAATTVTALERIQRMEKVVEAAVAWTRGGPHAALTDEVNAWLAYKKTWS